MRLHLHRERYVRQRGDADELRGHLAVVDFQEIRRVALGKLARFKNMRQLLGRFLDLDEVARLQLVAGDVDLAAVHLDVAVIDELAGGKHRGNELGAENNRVETALQEADQVLAGVALHAARFDIDAVELPLAAIGLIALELLLRRDLYAEVGKLVLASLAMLAWAVFPGVHGALRAL